MAYLIKKNSETKELIYMEYDLEGYSFKPKSKKSVHIKVNQVNIINPKMINDVLTIKFNKVFQKLLLEVKRVVEDDDAGTDDTIKVLGSVEMLKGLLLNKYEKFLESEREILFLEKLSILEKQIKVKLLLIRESLMNEEENVKRR